MVEQWVVAPMVTGSIPVARTFFTFLCMCRVRVRVNKNGNKKGLRGADQGATGLVNVLNRRVVIKSRIVADSIPLVFNPPVHGRDFSRNRELISLVGHSVSVVSSIQRVLNIIGSLHEDSNELGPYSIRNVDIIVLVGKSKEGITALGVSILRTTHSECLATDNACPCRDFRAVWNIHWCGCGCGSSAGSAGSAGSCGSGGGAKSRTSSDHGGLSDLLCFTK